MVTPVGAPIPTQKSVRTLLARPPAGSPCPVCGQAALQGRQTVCSAACRRRRSRQREAERQRQRDDALRGLALAVHQAIEALERRLADPAARLADRAGTVVNSG
jgi:predicted nucleic acid-binding Zn ribbon protein